MREKLKITFLLPLILLFSGSVYAGKSPGILGKRLSVTGNIGFSPKVDYIYGAAGYGSSDAGTDLLKYGLTSWNYQVGAGYALGSHVEAALNLIYARNFGVVHLQGANVVDPGMPVFGIASGYIVSTKPYRARYNTLITDMSFKFFYAASGDAAPAGAYIKLGFGLSHFSGTPDIDKFENNLSLKGNYMGRGPSGTFTQPLDPSQIAVAEKVLVANVNTSPFVANAFHLSYGFGYQRFYSNTVFTNIALEGSVPVGLLGNKDFSPGWFSSSYINSYSRRSAQESMAERAFVSNLLKFRLGIGVMIH